MVRVPPPPGASRLGPNIVGMGIAPGAAAAVPGGGMTLDALIARQKLLSNQQIELPQMTSPMQGVGYLAQSVMQGLNQGRADKQLAQGRQALAQAMTQFNPETGEFSPEAMATIGALEPDKAFTVLHDMAESRRAERRLQQEHDWTVEGREDTQQAAADLARQSQAASAHEAELNRQADDARQRLADAKAQGRQDDAQQAAQDLAKLNAQLDTQKATAAAETEAAKPQTDIAKIEADFKAGRIDQAQRDEAIKKATYVAPTKPSDLFTPGQQKTDQLAADQVLEWKQTNRPQLGQQLLQVKNALNILEKNPSFLTGATGAMGMLPDALKPYVNPQGTIASEAVKEAVQATLRQTLGAQYTQKEGEDLMNRAYNDKLPPEENVRRVKLLLAKLQAIGQAKEDMVKYWDEHNGTLAGYAGSQVSAADIYNTDFGDGVADGTGGTAQPSGKPGWKIEKVQ